MATKVTGNDTRFYSNYDRAVYNSGTEIVDTIKSSKLPGSDVILAAGEYLTIKWESPKKNSTHIFLKQSGLSSADVVGFDGTIADRVNSGNTTDTIPVSGTDDKYIIYELDDTKTFDDDYISIKNTGGGDASIDIAIAMELLVEFPDGAWSEQKPALEHRTRGHHVLLNGNKVPFPGLGLPKLKIELASDYLAYDYDKIAAQQALFGNSIGDWNQRLLDALDVDTNGEYYVNDSELRIWKQNKAGSDKSSDLNNLLPLLDLNGNVYNKYNGILIQAPKGKKYKYNLFTINTGSYNNDLFTFTGKWYPAYDTSNFMDADAKVDADVKTIAAADIDGYIQAVNPASTSIAIGTEDVKKLENVFLHHLEFVFADSLDNHPNRIFVASFDENIFEFPYSSGWKKLGHNVGLTVCEV